VKILIITPHRYNKIEFWGIIDALKKNDIEMDIRAVNLFISDEQKTELFKIEKKLTDPIDTKDYSGLIISSGHPKDTKYLCYDRTVEWLVREMYSQGKVLAAICSSVPALRYVVAHKTVSVFPLDENISLLQLAGATISSRTVTVDGNLVTAEFDAATEVWMREFIKKVKS